MLNEVEKRELCVYPCQICPCAARLIGAGTFDDDFYDAYKCTYEGVSRILDKPNTYCRKYGSFVLSLYPDRITRLPHAYYFDRRVLESIGLAKPLGRRREYNRYCYVEGGI